MQAMRFSFVSVKDQDGFETDRPVIPLRLDGVLRGKSTHCLLDSGDLNNYMDWELAYDVGIDPADGRPIPADQQYGGSEQRMVYLTCLVEDGRGNTITLPHLPIIFVRPWKNPGFGAKLGTLGMEHMIIALNSHELWTEISADIPQVSVRFNFTTVAGGDGHMVARPIFQTRLKNELPWGCIYYSRCFSVCDRAAAQRG